MDVDVSPLLALQRGRKAQAALLQLPPLSPVWAQGLIYPAGTHTDMHRAHSTSGQNLLANLSLNSSMF